MDPRQSTYSEESTCRWKYYGTYRLLILISMVNDMALVYSATEISHKAFYMHGLLFTASVVFIGIPLVYSEICIAQFTNCDITTMWDYFPIFRGLKYGIIYLLILKILLLIVLNSWYLEYTFYAALDPPPWFTCEDFSEIKCMVKRINVSIFQHCLDAQNLFDDDCGMKTASHCFFEREIGGHNTLNSLECVYTWKLLLTGSSICLGIYILSIRKNKIVQTIVKLSIVYLSFVIFILFCVALSTSGSWYASKIIVNWSNYGYNECCITIIRGFLTLNTGTGLLIFLSRDVPFRSPATMTAVAVPMFCVFTTLMMALIVFNGIRTMSYFHGEEENVIEIGESEFFPHFASISEILSYFDNVNLWGFLWFSSVFWCLFVNLWLLFIYLKELLVDKYFRNYTRLISFLLMLFLCICSWPFYCSDLTSSLSTAQEFIQIFNSFFFSFSLYWVYGYERHNVDIVFMIGVKASYFWKVTWVLNPIILLILLSGKILTMNIEVYDNSYIIPSLDIATDKIIFYVLFAIYPLILFCGMMKEIIKQYKKNTITQLFYPIPHWGPRDNVLFKSRQVFVPQIMTTEFLYRQVRIHGYGTKSRRASRKMSVEDFSSHSSSEKMEWSALTSN